MNVIVEVTIDTPCKLAILILHELLEAVTSQSFVLLMVNFMFLCNVRCITVNSSIKYPPLISHPGQLSLLPSAGQEMRIGQSAWVKLCSWGVKACMTYSTCVWQMKLYDPSLIRAITERLRDEYHNKALHTEIYSVTLL